MKAVPEIRADIARLWQRLPAGRRRPVQLMEVCGTHTVAVSRSGLRDLLPEGLRLISGPGCPVCVTDQSYVDAAVHLARKHDEVIIATYGDMLRVPGRGGSLEQARSEGAAIEIVYAASDAIKLAEQSPDRQVVFLGIGFETTTPSAAIAILQARRAGLENFTVFSAHKLLLPIMRAVLKQEDLRIDGFLCPGHVSVIIGWRAYEPLVRESRLPCVVAGFEDEQILLGAGEIVRQIVEDDPAAVTVYPAVSAEGNPRAQQLMQEVFQVADTRWRGLGLIPASGLAIADEFAAFDTEKRFDLPELPSYELPGCRCGEVICGRALPTDCPLFAARCTPRDPIGPCMVSSEGSCAAHYRFRRRPRRAAKT